MCRSFFLAISSFLVIGSSLQAFDLEFEIKIKDRIITLIFSKQTGSGEKVKDSYELRSHSLIVFNPSINKCFKNLKLNNSNIYNTNEHLFTETVDDDKEIVVLRAVGFNPITYFIGCQNGHRFFLNDLFHLNAIKL